MMDNHGAWSVWPLGCGSHGTQTCSDKQLLNLLNRRSEIRLLIRGFQMTEGTSYITQMNLNNRHNMLKYIFGNRCHV